jgi:hypothetical protein
VALSTVEDKYVSASEATAQTIWLRFVLDDFGEMHTEATPLFCDNMSANSTNNNMFYQLRSSIYTDSQRTIQFFLESCNGVMTWIFLDDFTDGMTEGFKPGYPYSDVTLSPTERVCR